MSPMSTGPLVSTTQLIANLIARRDELLAALEELLAACPAGFGNDRRLNEAQKQAESVVSRLRREKDGL